MLCHVRCLFPWLPCNNKASHYLVTHTHTRAAPVPFCHAAANMRYYYKGTPMYDDGSSEEVHPDPWTPRSGEDPLEVVPGFCVHTCSRVAVAAKRGDAAQVASLTGSFPPPCAALAQWLHRTTVHGRAAMAVHNGTAENMQAALDAVRHEPAPVGLPATVQTCWIHACLNSDDVENKVRVLLDQPRDSPWFIDVHGSDAVLHDMCINFHALLALRDHPRRQGAFPHAQAVLERFAAWDRADVVETIVCFADLLGVCSSRNDWAAYASSCAGVKLHLLSHDIARGNALPPLSVQVRGAADGVQYDEWARGVDFPAPIMEAVAADPHGHLAVHPMIRELAIYMAEDREDLDTPTKARRRALRLRAAGGCVRPGADVGAAAAAQPPQADAWAQRHGCTCTPISLPPHGAPLYMCCAVSCAACCGDSAAVHAVLTAPPPLCTAAGEWVQGMLPHGRVAAAAASGDATLLLAALLKLPATQYSRSMPGLGLLVDAVWFAACARGDVGVVLHLLQPQARAGGWNVDVWSDVEHLIALCAVPHAMQSFLTRTTLSAGAFPCAQTALYTLLRRNGDVKGSVPLRTLLRHAVRLGVSTQRDDWEAYRTFDHRVLLELLGHDLQLSSALPPWDVLQVEKDEPFTWAWHLRDGGVPQGLLRAVQLGTPAVARLPSGVVQAVRDVLSGDVAHTDAAPARSVPSELSSGA